jgi:hypothetical protein
MAKKAILIIAALISGTAGIFVFYLFLKSINDKANIIFLILSLVLIIASIVLIIFSTRQKKAKSSDNSNNEFADAAERLAKNNNILSEWGKTNETRDRLKLLKISGAAEEEAKKLG